MALLEVKDLRKSFGELEVLKGIGFSMERGETLSVIGPSGGGKTTLLRCMNFLEMPDSGTIKVGEDILFSSEKHTLSEEQIRRNRLHFGLVFQNFNLIAEIIKYSYKKVPVNREHVGNENCMCFSHFLSERSIAHKKTVPFLKCGEQTAEPYFYSSQICDLINFYLCIDTPVLFEN